MVEREGQEEKPIMPLSEEAQGALNIAAAVAPRVRNWFMEPHYYIEPLHLVLGLTKQASIHELLVKKGVDPDKMSDALIGFRPLFEADCKPQSGKDGGLSDRSTFAILLANRLAERAGRLEISAIDIAHGIIIEDQLCDSTDDPRQTHEASRFTARTPGSLLESIIGLPYRRAIEGEAEKEEKPDQPPEVSE